MTKAYSKPKSSKTQTMSTSKVKTKNRAAKDEPRHYTVGYRPNLGKGAPAPQLTIKGNWLNELGFTTGQPVTITAKKGKLIVQLAK